MDPMTRQESAYEVQNVMGQFRDKTKLAVAAVKGDETQVSMPQSKGRILCTSLGTLLLPE